VRTWGSTTIDSFFLLSFIYLFIYFLKLANQVWKQLFVFIIIYFLYIFLIFRFYCFNLDIFVIFLLFSFFLLLIIYFILLYFVKSPPFLFESFFLWKSSNFI